MTRPRLALWATITLIAAAFLGYAVNQATPERGAVTVQQAADTTTTSTSVPDPDNPPVDPGSVTQTPLTGDHAHPLAEHDHEHDHDIGAHSHHTDGSVVTTTTTTTTTIPATTTTVSPLPSTATITIDDAHYGNYAYATLGGAGSSLTIEFTTACYAYVTVWHPYDARNVLRIIADTETVTHTEDDFLDNRRTQIDVRSGCTGVEHTVTLTRHPAIPDTE